MLKVPKILPLQYFILKRQNTWSGRTLHLRIFRYLCRRPLGQARAGTLHVTTVSNTVGDLQSTTEDQTRELVQPLACPVATLQGQA